MFLEEPQATQADLRFRVFGFPVRVHPFFWLGTLFLHMGGGRIDPADTVIWVAVVFVSILVHELGHAFVQRRFGGHPWITLYGFGGLASCSDCDRRPQSQILISWAGPVAGFLLAGIVIALLFVSGHVERFHVDWIPVVFRGFQSMHANALVVYLLFVNIVWGLMNLLPIYPLDGGRISRELFRVSRMPDGLLRSLQLSMVTAAVVAAFALFHRELYLGVWFGLMAYANYMAMSGRN
jgi:stage IV sporulation protein FB